MKNILSDANKALLNKWLNMWYANKPHIHFPDLKGGIYKTELNHVPYSICSDKLILWYADDPRTCTSIIFSGGFRERLTFYSLGDTLQDSYLKYKAIHID